jgi:hypothetical protein
MEMYTAGMDSSHKREAAGCKKDLRHFSGVDVDQPNVTGDWKL